MDRKAVSAIALLATAFAINQHQPIDNDTVAAAHAGLAGAQTGHYQSRTAKPPAAAALDPDSACGIGAVCDALIPYRETGPWTASCAWFGTRGQPIPNRAESLRLNSNAPERLGKETADWCLPVKNPPALSFLIVMVPDPVTTHLALYFDRTIEALEAAAQQHNLFLDRYWLPWPVPGGTIPPGDTAQDFRVTEILNSFRSGQPGVMIFSDNDKQTCAAAGSGGSCVTYAFMVSESPTSGINKTQFENAVGYAGVLSQSAAPAVHVVGPFFSGSTPSAIALAKNVPPDGARLDFVSGTMSSRVQANALRDAHLDFRQTLHDDSRAQAFLLDFLYSRSLTKTGKNVAILQEDETRYGADPPVSAVPVAPVVPADLADLADLKTKFPNVRYIKFPRELSRLRNASADNFGVAPAAPGQYSTAPTDELSWNWKDAAKGGDSVPAYSGQQSPLSQQAVLLSISDIIRQQNLKYVGIAATDIFDILFLSKFLKIAAPNTRVFVLDSDLLMVKASSEGRELDGTLTVTTYPLLARNEDWTQPAGRQRSVDIFPSRITQGIYNAVLLQLDPRKLREYADPLFDPSDSVPNNRPPLWLTMVGRTGFWPVSREKNLSPDQQAAPSPGPASELAGNVHDRLTFDPPDGTSLLLEVVLLLWGMIHLSGLMFAKQAKYSWFRQFHIRSQSAHSAHAQHQTYYLFCGTLALGTMLELIAISSFYLSLHGAIAFINPVWFPYLFPVFYVVVGITGVTLTGYAVWIASRPILKSVPTTYFLPSLLLYAVTILLWSYLNSWRDGDGMFFAQRAFSFSNKVSPLLPVELLLLMYYLWAWTFIRKARLSESKQVEIPALDLLGPAGHGLETYWIDLRAATDDIVFNPQIGKPVTIAFASVILFLLRPWETLRSVEGGYYDWLVTLLVLFICLVIVMVWGRYLYIWNRLRRILRGLERTSLRRAFSRFPNTYAWSPLWYEDAERRAYLISARSVECFQALVVRGGFGILGRQLSDEMTRAFQSVVALDADDADENQRSTAVYELQKFFFQASRHILNHDLRDRWLVDGGSDTLDKTEDSAAKTDGADTAYQCRLLAEEFVALRFVGLIHYESAQLKNLVVFLGIGFVLAVLAVGSYPFLAARQCVWSLAAVFVVFGAAIIVSFAQMDRDAVLSRLSGTVAGQLDWSFYLRALSYGGLPLLTLLASQFPSLGHSLLAWLEPALNALH
jgi:hypothetical protein